MIRALVRVAWVVSLFLLAGHTYLLVAGVPDWPRWLFIPHGATTGLCVGLSWVVFGDVVRRRRIAMLQRQYPGADIWGVRRTWNLPAALARIDGTLPSPPGTFPRVYFVVADRDGVAFVARPGRAPWRRFAWREVTEIGLSRESRSPCVALMIPVASGLPATVDFTVYRADGWSYLRTDQREVQPIAETLEGLRTAAANDRTLA